MPVEVLKLHQRVAEDDEDKLIANLIEAAYDYLSGPEGWLNGYCLLEESFELYVDTLGSRLELPVRRFFDADLVSVERFDLTSGQYQDLDVGLYTVLREDDYGVIGSLSGRPLGKASAPGAGWTGAHGPRGGQTRPPVSRVSNGFGSPPAPSPPTSCRAP